MKILDITDDGKIIMEFVDKALPAYEYGMFSDKRKVLDLCCQIFDGLKKLLS